MALNKTAGLELGARAPDFDLPDPAGQRFTLNSFSGSKALLVVFMCNHCPYVKHLKSALAAFARDYRPKGLSVVGINANDWGRYPEDSPERMALDIKTFNYTFPYVIDESQATARAYGAVCTPDFYLFDQDRRLVYRGQFDDSRPGGGKPVTGKDLVAAVDATLSGVAYDGPREPSIGCSIKWRQ